MQLILALGFLLTLGLVQGQDCTNKRPSAALLPPPKTWVPNPGCKDPRGSNWYNTDNDAVRCHCWSGGNVRCGYICEPNPFTPPPTTPAAPTTQPASTTTPTPTPTGTKPSTTTTTTPAPATCTTGSVIMVPNKSAPTFVCVCQAGAYACYPI